jgi:hypothetical protein
MQTLSRDQVELDSILDRVVEVALQMHLSESELTQHLLERFLLKSEKCRSVVHLSDDEALSKKRMCNPEASS